MDKKQLAQLFADRAKRQGWKKAALAKNAVEFMVGVVAAIAVIEGDKSANFNEASMIAFMVSCRGPSELLKFAEAA
jgi:hypothetical protein